MSHLAMVLGLLAAAVVMFAINRPRMDVVALIMMVALPFTGVITMAESLAGLADPNIVLIAALFVIGEGLVRTGVAQRLGDWLASSAGASEARLVVLLMVIVAAVGSVMSSTGVVAIFIPIVLRIARKSAIPAARLMMPLSVAALISGMMTLVATAPNLVIQAEMVRRGHEGFHFFSFTPFGVPILAFAIAYMLVVRGTLGRDAGSAAPSRVALASWIEDYGLAGRERRVRVGRGSPLAGQALKDVDMRSSAGINIIAIERPSRLQRALIEPRADTRIEAGDVLLLDLLGGDFDLGAFAQANALEDMPLTGQYFTDTSQEIGMAQVMVPPASRLVGKTLISARFRSTYDLTGIGLRHGADIVDGDVPTEPLRAGDTLLTVGPWRAIRRLLDDRRDLVLLDLPAEWEEAVPEPRRAPIALAILLLVVVLMVTGVVPNVHAALLGCLLLGAFRCIDMDGAYRSIHWQSLILIVGMLPFSLALQRTGGVDMAAQAMLALLGEGSPRLVLAVIFLVTGVLGLFISNTATAVLMAPVALTLAADLGASPYPFAMCVALAASAAFMTPVSSPVNTLVVGPGNYSFGDFLRIGLPLFLVAMATSILLLPLILPF